MQLFGFGAEMFDMINMLNCRDQSMQPRALEAAVGQRGIFAAYQEAEDMVRKEPKALVALIGQLYS